MSRFYGNMKGARGETTRCGTACSGIRAHVRGWDLGVRARAFVGPDGQDMVEVYLTGGSNASLVDVSLGVFCRKGDAFIKVYQGESIPYLYQVMED